MRSGHFVLVESGPKKNWGDGFESKSFILTEPRLETEKLKTAYKRQFGRSLPVLFEISSWDVIGQLAQRGMGVGLLPDISLKNWKKGSFKIIKNIDFECPYEIYVHTFKAPGGNRALEYIRDDLLKSE